MQKIYCKYHPQIPARWSCQPCKTVYCKDCIPLPKRMGEQPVCPICKTPLSAISIANSIPPFWKQIPSFFAYPFKLENLFYILFMTTASLLVFIPIAGKVLGVVWVISLLKYGYTILEHTALGNLEPPSITNKGQNYAPYKQLVIFTLIFGLVFAINILLGPLAGIVAYIALLISIPASVMALAMSGSLFFALNPANWARLIGAVGWPYGLLYIFLHFLSDGTGFLIQFLLPILPTVAVLIIFSLLTSYFTLVMFHLMGYVIYQYHDKLGITQVKEYAQSNSPKQPIIDELESTVNILVSEGKMDQALERLRTDLRHSGVISHHLKFHKLLLLAEDTEELATHGITLINLLLANGQKNNALTVMAECAEKVPNFHLEDGTKAYELAEAAFEQNRFQEASLRILKGFSQRYPKHKLIPNAGFLAAKILCEYKLQDTVAISLLSQLLKEYPDHELVDEMEEYVLMLKRLKAVGTKG